MIEEVNKDEVYSFVMSREQPEGGFSFSKTTPRTLEDTYHALRILEMLNIKYDNKKTFKYIASINPNFYDAKQLFHLSYLNLKYNLREVTIQQLNKIRIRYLKDFYYKLRLSYLLGINIEEDALMKEYDAVKKEKSEYLSDICYNSMALKMLHKQFDEEYYKNLINSFQNPDGGWGFVKDSTSFLENSYIAILALNEMNAKPIHINACRQFILRCQSNHGGFGRQFATVPSIEATYYALASLSMLENPQKRL